MKIKKEELKRAVKNSNSFRGVTKYLGIKYRSDIKKIIQDYNIDFSHFTHGKVYTSALGKKFNKLTVHAVMSVMPSAKDKRKRPRAFFRCLCDCGNECTTRADAVKSGRVISCGCAVQRKGQFMRGPNNPAYAGVGDLSGSRFSEIKSGAKKRNIEFKLTKKYLWNLFTKQNKKCALTGEDLWFGRRYFPAETNASLDRIDSSKGYIKSNVQWVHKDINRMKHALEQKYFIELCKKVASVH